MPTLKNPMCGWLGSVLVTLGWLLAVCVSCFRYNQVSFMWNEMKWVKLSTSLNLKINVVKRIITPAPWQLQLTYRVGHFPKTFTGNFWWLWTAVEFYNILIAIEFKNKLFEPFCFISLVINLITSSFFGALCYKSAQK